MHTERLTILAEWLENGAKHERIVFDMSKGVKYLLSSNATKEELTTCQTACCIAGATTMFFNNPEKMLADEIEYSGWEEFSLGDEAFGKAGEISWATVMSEARDLLDLDYDQARQLFEPHEQFGGKLQDYSDPAWAARTIRHLLATGEADWYPTRTG